MSIAIGEDREALAATARRFLADRCPPAVARAAMEAEAEALPPFWGELAGLGWLGLAVAGADGGEGYGYADLAVVVEQLGRVVAPGPMLPTAWAAALAPPEARPDLAAGRRVGAVALGGSIAGTPQGEGRLRLTGSTGPVLCGAVADLVVVPVTVGGDERWAVVERAGATATPLAPLDPTRGLARLDLAGAIADPVPGLDRARVEAVGVALAAAEAAGGAAWCVEVAAAYARDRRQFGRPIGQFQAVKHRCADMLVGLEQARAVAWDAAAALDGDPRGDDTALAVAAAGAVAFEAYAAAAKDCIQVLGGIGFTWEHDAHLYLRRAAALRQLFGGAAPWRVATARAALDGVRRHLGLELPADAESFRAEVRTTVEEIAELPRDERRRRLADTGLLVPHWAPPWGRNAGAAQQLVIDQELRRAKVRVPHLQVGAWAAPTIAAHGTPEQQERWVGPTLHGEIAWCQLFSEPDAGSDLASLTTTATRSDGGWLLDGQKVWTTMAAEADWGICLARTDAEAPKHLGITYFVVDMTAPGIEIRPLREL
ncbi:MAG TPA: acyl-CoA dehydrogenase, partial [Acidimicrobiales bacterium]|nr:acyl-CoA dehydrogenase [Acidimicrobiales bacterium]